MNQKLSAFVFYLIMETWSKFKYAISMTIIDPKFKKDLIFAEWFLKVYNDDNSS